MFFRSTEISSKYLWVPSHVGLEDNEIADKLAKKDTTLHAIETPLHYML